VGSVGGEPGGAAGLLREPHHLREVGVEEGLAPSREVDVLDIGEVLGYPFVGLEGHVGGGPPVSEDCSGAHGAAVGALGGDSDLEVVVLPLPAEEPEHLAYDDVEGAQVTLEGDPADIGFWV
jgi:hypothetical protein